jgi:hypothetical protein
MKDQTSNSISSNKNISSGSKRPGPTPNQALESINQNLMSGGNLKHCRDDSGISELKSSKPSLIDSLQRAQQVQEPDKKPTASVSRGEQPQCETTVDPDYFHRSAPIENETSPTSSSSAGQPPMINLGIRVPHRTQRLENLEADRLEDNTKHRSLKDQKGKGVNMDFLKPLANAEAAWDIVQEQLPLVRPRIEQAHEIQRIEAVLATRQDELRGSQDHQLEPEVDQSEMPPLYDNTTHSMSTVSRLRSSTDNILSDRYQYNGVGVEGWQPEGSRADLVEPHRFPIPSVIAVSGEWFPDLCYRVSTLLDYDIPLGHCILNLDDNTRQRLYEYVTHRTAPGLTQKYATSRPYFNIRAFKYGLLRTRTERPDGDIRWWRFTVEDLACRECEAELRTRTLQTTAST